MIKTIATALAGLATGVILGAAPVSWGAEPGFVPPTPAAPATYRCAPDVARGEAEAVLVRGSGQRYQLVEGRRFFRLLTPTQTRRATWCNAIVPARVQR